MGVPTRIEGDVYVNGNLSALTNTPSSAVITDAMVSATAALAYTKLQHEHRHVYAQPNTTATTETKAVHVVRGATATIVKFEAGSIVACLTTATITVDLKKNGTTVLSAVITLDNANTAYVTEAATISSASLVIGDVLTVVITATAAGGTIGTGFFCAVSVAEAGQ